MEAGSTGCLRQGAKEALTLVSQTLHKLGLQLSPEKTKITTYGKGYSFLGFVLSSRSRRMGGEWPMGAAPLPA
jgi:hypothetical protein